MRIKTLRVSKEEAENLGLKQYVGNKLNSVVALVGKNGAGKSRYLKVIASQLLSSTMKTDFALDFEKAPSNLVLFSNEYKKNSEVYNKYFDYLKADLEYKTNNNTQNLNELNRASSAYNNANMIRRINPDKYIRNNQAIQSEIKKRVKIISPNDLRKLQASFDLNDTKKISFQSIVDSVENAEVNEFEMISESALTFFKKLPHRLSYDDIQSRGDDKVFKEKVSYKRFEQLSSLIFEFLGKKLLWHSKEADLKESDDYFDIRTTGYWTIQGREFDYNDFSEGEKVLFTYAILLFLLGVNNPNIKFKESIIIIDEPELNLHPKAQIKLIQRLQELIKDEGQLIIATHSLSIIANLDYSSIYLVREGELSSPSSSVPFDAVDELMGFEEHYNKIVEFLVSTPSWAMTNFMAQCFEDAEVFESANKNDPQLEVFKRLILENNNITLLDFGSGKGRLLERITESNDVKQRIKIYDCFDVNDSYNELVLSKGASNVINKLDDLQEKKYDLVILVNVLHEIHIKYWIDSLKTIKKCLNENGYVAIVEDIELPIGELPNELGFLLLEKEEMQILMGKKMNFISPISERYKDRIVCGFISQDEMNVMTVSKLITTLERLKTNSLKKIIEYREQKQKGVGLGRLYALKANSYVNSQLAIDYLNKL